MEEKFSGVWEKGEKLYTENLVPGEKVYGENLMQKDGQEYREWNPNRSKLGAAIKKGIPQTGIKKDSKVLYLGAASGTTPSHVSDIVKKGIVYAVEYSHKVINDLLSLSDKRENLAPILADARKPEEYKEIIGKVDVVFQDIAQPDQFEIAEKNIKTFLKEGGVALIAIKAKSISSSRPTEEIFNQVKEKFEEEYKIDWNSTLAPYEKDHIFLKVQKS
ncbi:MAG: fibrillarin-like rRNA/tRNA 2'-O-methyltransferase [Candidatus Nanohaloarchaeota archaeon QJJ-9]|nr:fibrillarin-like rRNA/tRNA 2'-O-methyltransferase [Candidatus Nanohaloarchaeota archaeon QJJ-9]